MDQHSLSLKFFKDQRGKTNTRILFLRRKRVYKKNLNPYLNERVTLYLSKKGQVLIEGLFVIICILFFLIAVQFFQALARREIQKERLTKQDSYRIKPLKAPWYKPTQ